MTGINLTALDAMTPGVLALICAGVMAWPVIYHAANERWVGMAISLGAAGLLMNIGIGTTLTQLEQGLFPASRHWAPPPTGPVLRMAWVTSILMLLACVVMCTYTKGYQVEFFSASALVGIACASNLRWLSGDSYSGEWMNAQRICEGAALFLLLICGPIRASVRGITRRI